MAIGEARYAGQRDSVFKLWALEYQHLALGVVVMRWNIRPVDSPSAADSKHYKGHCHIGYGDVDVGRRCVSNDNKVSIRDKVWNMPVEARTRNVYLVSIWTSSFIHQYSYILKAMTVSLEITICYISVFGLTVWLTNLEVYQETHVSCSNLNWLKSPGMKVS